MKLTKIILTITILLLLFSCAGLDRVPSGTYNKRTCERTKHYSSDGKYLGFSEVCK